MIFHLYQTNEWCLAKIPGLNDSFVQEETFLYKASEFTPMDLIKT